MNKYGIENFSFEIVEECKKDELSNKEKYWIEYYNTTPPNGYNLTKGGDGGNTFQYRTKDEMEITRKRISEANSGTKNSFYGKHHSHETKAFLRKINLGKTLSKETKKKLSESLQGHYMPEHAKQKISNATKKQWQNENFKKLMSNINKGNKYAQGNDWNKNRIDIFHPDTYEHKRILKGELDSYMIKGYILGISPNDKRHQPKIKHCTNDNLIGVRFDKKSNKWQAYISYRNKRYGSKVFNNKQDAIRYRNCLENIFEKITEENINVLKVDVQESLKQNKIVLYCD